MRVLIIGCGYVGLAVGAELARRGHVVFGVRRNPATGSELLSAGIQPLFADITNPTSLAKLPRDCDWVVNCAGSGSSDVADYRRLYLEGTRNLIAWLAAAPPARYLYTSSTSVYGQDDGSLVNESAPTAPDTDTGRVLVETEQTLLDTARTNGFPGIVLRVAGIYGPGRGYYLREFLRGQARLEGAGRRFVNMIHRDDVVSAILAALERGRPGQAYNVCDDEPATLVTVYTWLAETLKLPLPRATPEDPYSMRRRGATNKRVSNHRLRAELGCALKFPTFREGYTAELRRQGLLPGEAC
ncbi:MAG TPA: SDR family oxidoreductase [Verrucomicrobiae bacterium]